MLEELYVRDLALIDEVSLEFGPGLTALTGETGAGKTALVGALKLLVGERADSGAVRSGASEARVEGRVVLGDREIVATRRVGADGRSRCRLDGEMTTVGELSETLGPLFDLHGQHEHQSLLHPARHVRYLDRYIGEPARAAHEAYRDARRAFQGAEREHRDVEERLADAGRRADYLRFVAEEIEAIDPAEAEDDELERRLPALRHGDRLIEACASAYAALGGEGGSCDDAAVAGAALARVGGLDPELDGLAQRLDVLAKDLGDLARSIRDYGEDVEHDPGALNQVEARLAALSVLKKKYGPDLAAVRSTRDDARARLDAFESGEAALAEVRARLAASRDALLRAGELLAKVRGQAISDFVAALGDEVSDLAMAGTRFEVSFVELPFESWTDDGSHRVEFLFAPGPDQPARPLGKIASGGEISRVMLAMKSVFGDADEVPVLVFDEIDAGIGGATALAVGRRLAALAERHQVIVVTHLPQVAAFADHHLVVSKSTENGTVSTAVVAAEGPDRIGEIARMLAGEETDAARTHAKELLEAAARR